METNLLDRMLNSYQEARTPVSIQLQNKVRISGRIQAFDSYVIIMEGQKREIVYRHAVSSISASVQTESRQPAQAAKQSPSRPPKQAAPKQRPSQPTSAPSTVGEGSINNSMKEGLLKWMQEQKAAK